MPSEAKAKGRKALEQASVANAQKVQNVPVTGRDWKTHIRFNTPSREQLRRMSQLAKQGK